MSATSSYIIRRLTAADIPLLRALLDVFGRAFEEPSTYTAAQPRTSYLERLLHQETFIALVALQDSVVVGGLAAYELQKFEQERSEIYLYDLAVDSAHRRQGIATSLIRELQTIAAQRGAWTVFVQADLQDAPAIALYTRMGVREDVLHFDIPISPQAPQRPQT